MQSLDAVRPLHVADVTIEGETVGCFAHVIEHDAGLVLVDTGMVDRHPEVDEQFDPRLTPVTEYLDPADVVAVVNTHLHFDHCGANRLFAGTPIYVQRAEREAARGPDYTIPEWVEFEGARYEELDGEAEVLPGIRLLPTPGHTPGHQSVLVETAEGLVVCGGDVAHSLDELESEERLLSLNPRRIWIAHSAEPWEASTMAS